MKIIEAVVDKKLVPFSELKPGDVFRLQGKIYMKCIWGGVNNDVVWPAALEDGASDYIYNFSKDPARDNTLVEPLKVELRILE